jgi:hypothetical protein
LLQGFHCNQFLPLSFKIQLLEIFSKKQKGKIGVNELFIFEVDKFLKTLLRLEQWQKRLPGTQQGNLGLVWKIERK